MAVADVTGTDVADVGDVSDNRRAPDIEGVDVTGTRELDVVEADIPKVAEVAGTGLMDATDEDVADVDVMSGNVASVGVCLLSRDFGMRAGSGLGRDDVADIAADADVAGMVEEAVVLPPPGFA